MRIFKKLAAAAAVVMAISTLAACGNDDQDLFAQVENDPTRKITSADSTAKEMIQIVNTWIADDVSMGGAEKRRCELSIVMNNGKAKVTDTSGKNNWNGKKGEKAGCPETLQERFESDYPGRTFTAKVFIDDSGYAVYSWFVPDDAGFNGDAPSFEDFSAGRYNWSTKIDGFTRENVIIGTSPKLVGSFGADER